MRPWRGEPLTIMRERKDGPGRELALVRWGLIPPWADELSIGNRLFNGRAEGIASKPSFRSAFRRRRCLVLAVGFEILPERWVVERTFAWLAHNRRLATDFKALVANGHHVAVAGQQRATHAMAGAILVNLLDN